MDQRLALLEAFGIDAAVIFHFDEGLAEASPAEFVTDWLASGLGVGGVVTGHDFTFGHDWPGDLALLDRFCAAMGFEAARSEERRGGEECVKSGSSGWSPYV